MEIWKDVVGYEGIYEVSSVGSIRTKIGKVTSNARYKNRIWKQRVLKLKTDKQGYKRVSLYKEGKSKDFLVHRIVAKAFIENPSNFNIINHKDGVSSNNHVSNLEWCDSYMNNNHAFDNNLIKTGSKIILEDLNTGELHRFRSMVKASEFLGKKQEYVCQKLLKGKHEFQGYRCYRSIG